MENKEFINQIIRWRKKPSVWVEDIFGLKPQPLKEGYVVGINTDLQSVQANWFMPFEKGKHITWQQWVVLLAVERGLLGGKRFISVSSGHGTGKSATMALLLLWFLMNYENSQIPCTAPTAQQMYDVLWKEVSLWHSRMPENFRDNIEVESSYVRVKAAPKSWFARAATARKEAPEALAGIHSDNTMLMGDEACFDEETEILTDDGFKFIKDLRDEKVLMMDDGGLAFFEKPLAYHKYEGERKMYVYKKKGADFKVTSNHRMLYRTLKLRKLRLKEIQNIGSSNSYFPRKVDYRGDMREEFIVPEYQSERMFYPEKVFSMSDWIKFVAWYLAEGTIDSNGYVVITQCREVNKQKCLELENLFKTMGLKYTQYRGKDYHLRYRQIAKELDKYGKGFYNKFVPKYIKHSGYANLFLDTFVKGDGYIRNKRRIFYSSSQKLSDDIQEMLYLSGSAGTKTLRKNEGKKWYKNHYICSKVQAYSINERLPTDINYRSHDVRVLDHKGSVYCVTVSTGRIFIRRNGLCMWSGNSAIPEEVFITGEGALTNKNAFFLMFSNYTRLNGYFHRSQLNEFDEWQVLSFSSADSPIVEKGFIERMSRRGEDSNEYRIRVAGKPPKQDEEIKGFVPLLQESDLRFTLMDTLTKPVILGIDPSGGGINRSAFCLRDSFRLVPVGIYQDMSTAKMAQHTVELMESYKISPDNVMVDGFGVGMELLNEFAKLRIPIMGILVGNPADDPVRFANKKAEMYWRFREWILKGGELVGTRKQWDQILSIRYGAELSKVKIMGKKAMRDAKLDSPDLIEAAALTFCKEYYEIIDEENKEFQKEEDWDPHYGI